MTTTTHTECPLCIDGFAPAGTHPILGPVYRLCPGCGRCDFCGAVGVYPASTHCLGCFLEETAATGHAPILCAGCGAILHLIPTTAGGDL